MHGNIGRFCALATGLLLSSLVAGAETADVASLQSSLLSSRQLNVTGELLYQMPAYSPTNAQYEKFSLKFDRPTGRMR